MSIHVAKVQKKTDIYTPILSFFVRYSKIMQLLAKYQAFRSHSGFHIGICELDDESFFGKRHRSWTLCCKEPKSSTI